MNAFTLLGLSASTGLASFLWSRVAAASPSVATGLNVISYGIVAAVLAASAPRGTAWPSAGLAFAYVAASATVALLWVQALPVAPIGVLALAEPTYPLFVLALSRAFGSAPLSCTTCIGAGLVMIGAPLIAVGGNHG